MERHNGKKKKKRCRDKETMPTEMPVPQSHVCRYKKRRRGQRERRECQERGNIPGNAVPFVVIFGFYCFFFLYNYRFLRDFSFQ